MSQSGKKHKPLSTNPKIVNAAREQPKGASHMRDRATINRLKMYNTRAHYNKRGDFVSGAFMTRTTEKPVARIQPDRRWFGNTRVVGQKELEAFREQMGNKVHDPYTVVLKQSKLPMALLTDPYQNKKMDLLAVESFATTFGPKSLRKKARLPENIGDITGMLTSIEAKVGNYDEQVDLQNKSVWRDDMRDDVIQSVFKKGQSKRIWNELYKVIDSSDVIVQVLDVRDPMGTRCRRIEQELKKKDRVHKHMVFVLNKCDLVPTWVTRRWVKILSREYPTLAFHASITNPFGKGSLLQLFKQLSTLHADKKQISIGFVGYPNVGKSSIINTLKGENVCAAAPLPGETKTWRYITLFKRIYLIDCPGIVYPFDNTPTDCVLKNVVRMENIKDPADFIGPILSRLRPQYVMQHFGVGSWTSPMDFLNQLGRKSGKLLKGGDIDINNTARMVLGDWQLGRLPYFVCPPFEEEKEDGFDMSLIGAETHNAEKRKRMKIENGEEIEDDEENKEEEEVSQSEEESEEEEGQAFDDGLNDSDDDSEDGDGKESVKQKFKRQKRNKLLKKKNTETKIRLEVESQNFGNMPQKSRYSKVDLDERTFMKAAQEKLLAGAETFTSTNPGTAKFDFQMNDDMTESTEAQVAAEDMEFDVVFNQEAALQNMPLFADTTVPETVKALFDLMPVSVKKSKHIRESEKERALLGKSLVVLKGEKSGIQVRTHLKDKSKNKKRKANEQ